MFTKRLIRLAPVFFVLAAVPLTAHAGARANVSRGITLEGAPLAIHGFDPVAYFTQGKAVPGDARYAVVHEGATYRFSSESNRAAFAGDAGRFVPQYGGFCAYGVALGAKFDGDPRVFALVDGRLYFNLSPDIQEKWNEDRPGFIRKAGETWPKIQDRDPSELKK